MAVGVIAGGCDFITNASLQTSGSGLFNVEGATLSNDGRLVAFSARSVQGSDLVAPEFNTNVFVRDIRTGAVTAISTPLSGASEGTSDQATISADGKTVAFITSSTNLVANDTNNRIDVMARKVAGGPIQRISVNAQGAQGDNDSFDPSLSSDGNLLAFDSEATNLVPGDTNATDDVFLANLSAHTIIRLTGAGGGFHPSISADGRFVGYESDDPNVVPNDTNGRRDVFVRTLSTGAVVRAAVGVNGDTPNDSSEQPALSRDGHYVAFTSEASNLVVGDTDHESDIFRRDLQTGTTEWISVAADGGPGRKANGTLAGAHDPSISGNGRQVAFFSVAANLTAVNNPQDRSQAHVRDVLSHRTTFGSADNEGTPSNGALITGIPPGLSGDGRYVAFFTNATNLIDGEPVDDAYDVYVHYSERADINRVNPSRVARGTTTTVTVNGAGYLSGATVAVTGQGVQVSDIVVTGPNSARFTLTVAPDAPPAARDVTVTNIGTGPGPGANSESVCQKCLTIT